jgi:hypothetical protein
MEEVVEMDKGEFFILIVPADQPDDDADEIGLRNQFLKRALSHICSSRSDLKRDEVFDFVKTRNGVERNSSIYIELPCYVTAYPKRGQFVKNEIEGSELEALIDQGEGLGIRFLDYPSRDRLDIKWKEASSLQFWTQHFRGDSRRIERRCRGEESRVG